MQLSFKEELVSNEEFIRLDEGFRTYITQYDNWCVALNPCIRWVDSTKQIYVYFSGEDWEPQDPRPYAHVALVQWQEKQFRFYFQIFYLPENDEFYGDIRDSCWTVFRIDLVKGWEGNESQNTPLVQSMITRICVAMKSLWHPRFVDKTTVKFVDQRFESRPTLLLGE